MAEETRAARRLRFLRSGINANFTVVCKGREWKVDRGILAAESEYFEKMAIGGFSVRLGGFHW
jgi:BTB/POZ domain